MSRQRQHYVGITTDKGNNFSLYQGRLAEAKDLGKLLARHPEIVKVEVEKDDGRFNYETVYTYPETAGQ